MEAAEAVGRRAIAREPVAEVADRSRSIRAYGPDRAFILAICDLVMFGIASIVVTWFLSRFYHTLSFGRIFESAMIWVSASLFTFKRLGLYRISYALDQKDEWYYVLAGLAIGVAPLMMLFTIVPSLSSSRLVLVCSFAVAVVLVGETRAIIHRSFKLQASRRKRRIALVAPPAESAAIALAMQTPAVMLRVFPVPDVEKAIDEALSSPVGSWYAQAREEGCDELVFAGLPSTRTALIVERAARDHISVGFAPPGMLSPYGLEILTSKRQSILVAGRAAACTPVNRLLKRIFDLIVANVVLVLTAPLMLAGMLAVFVESGAPVLYRQTRVGRDGRPFEILKIRSMVQNAEAHSGPVWTPGDPAKDTRATKAGVFLRKTSIDELPQLFNVLRGEMSIVGPRPERPVFVQRFRQEYPRYDERHLVRPGITGWSQLHMRRNPDIAWIGEKVDLDLFYIENYSLFIDVTLVVKTAVEVLFHQW
ncbi:MAG TPA: sugar transferase [Candidatus Baltobacteraceae bacterium]|jgi:exopolysaccharide biosynthesis polyprenyl glycosylphosphotransferase|nr:sugar transferase [Candidatus Baltobacteraceae bacterium]